MNRFFDSRASLVGTILTTVIVSLAIAHNVFSVAGSRTTLPRGAEKSFGLFDPHLHVSVVDVAKSSGGYCWVTVKLRSDAARATIDPPDLEFLAIDQAGERHRPISYGDEAWPRLLSPGGSFERTILFDLPENAGEPVLWVTYDSRVDRLIPDHENGFVWRQIVFALD